MAISEQELRAMIRDAIARHASGGSVLASGGRPVAEQAPAGASTTLHVHGSHALFAVVSAGDECVIEPSRTCDHCGYCKSLGH